MRTLRGARIELVNRGIELVNRERSRPTAKSVGPLPGPCRRQVHSLRHTQPGRGLELRPAAPIIDQHRSPKFMQETGCLPATSAPKLRCESIRFSDIPGQSKLFLQYQSDPLILRKFYPNAVRSHTELAGHVSEVLANFETDRDALCSILTEQNRRFNAGPATFDNIDLLRQKNAVAVVTGQQTGLFTGPLYTIYKAMSAIAAAKCLRDRGVSAVPVFWAATEDHDFAEIAEAVLVADDAQELKFKLDIPPGSEGQPVGGIAITQEFSKALARGFESLPRTEFRDELISSLTAIWRPGTTIGNAFCKHIQYLFRHHGLVVVDPLDAGLKKLAAPIYERAARNGADIVAALLARSEELVADGYHAQVLITPDYCPLFYHTSDDGVRRAVRQHDGTFRVAGTRIEFTGEEMTQLTSHEPERFSPNVMLRSVVQDYLFPTVCYFGGGAEIAYFAQNSEVYRILDRPVTPILHRQSFTIIEPKHQRTLEKFELQFTDLFAGLDGLLPRIVDRFVNPSTARLFADAEDNIGVELNRLDQELSKIDPTLAANLATRRRKIAHHISALRNKFRRVQVERDKMVNRRVQGLFGSVLPEAQLQERVLNVTSFIARYGPGLLKWVEESIDLDDRGHRVLYLK
jgi:bacillithiol synthase